MAACVAVISNLNQLLYICTADCPDPLFYHFKAHSALDIIEDKLSKCATNGNQEYQQERYLGLLYQMEDHRLYGYVTNTKVKFIMIFESHAQVLHPITTQSSSPIPPTSPNASSASNNNSTFNTAASQQPTTNSATSANPHRDAEIRQMFGQLHKAYVDLVSCPFYKPNSLIEPCKLGAAKRFDEVVSQTLLANQASSGYCTTLTKIIDQSKLIAGSN